MSYNKNSRSSLSHVDIEGRTEYRPVTFDGYGTNYKVNRRGDVYSTFIRHQKPVFVKHVMMTKRMDIIPNCQLHIGHKAQRKNKFCPVDRLVADAFVPNPHHYQYLIHLDHRLTNVHADNLRWVSRAEWLRQERDRQRHLVRARYGGRLLKNSDYYITRDGRFHSTYRHSADAAPKRRSSWGNSIVLKNLQGKRKSYHADELVARSFIPNPHGYHYIKHLNCDIYDDRVANLAWCDENEMVLYNYFYGNPDLRGYHIVNVNGHNTLYAINDHGDVYSLMKRRNITGRNKRPHQIRLFKLKIGRHVYSWSREQIRKYATPVPDYQQSLRQCRAS